MLQHGHNDAKVLNSNLSSFQSIVVCLFVFKDFIYLFVERGEGREKEKETSMCSCLLRALTGDLAHNPGMFPD